MDEPTHGMCLNPQDDIDRWRQQMEGWESYFPRGVRRPAFQEGLVSVVTDRHVVCGRCGGEESALIHNFGGEFDPAATPMHEFVPEELPWAGETELLYALAATFPCELRSRPHSIPTASCEERADEDERYVSSPPTEDWPPLDRGYCRSCTARAACEHVWDATVVASTVTAPEGRITHQECGCPIGEVHRCRQVAEDGTDGRPVSEDGGGTRVGSYPSEGKVPPMPPPTGRKVEEDR